MSENTECCNADKVCLEETLGFQEHIGQGQVAGHTDQECTHCWKHTEDSKSSQVALIFLQDTTQRPGGQLLG